MADSDREVVVYTSPFCAPCEQLKQYLTANGVQFKVRDLMMDEAAQECPEPRVRYRLQHTPNELLVQEGH